MINILLVDDDSEDQIIFCEAINTLKIAAHCKSVSNGQEALNHLQKISNYNFIFLDLNMPVMNGLECLKTIKSTEKYKNIPVVIFTTSVNPIDHEACNALGINKYWHKPNTFTELCNKLHNVLTNQI